MKFKFKADGTHNEHPIQIDIEVEFEKGEYLDIAKAMPGIIGEIKTLINQEKKMSRARKAMRKNANKINREGK